MAMWSDATQNKRFIHWVRNAWKSMQPFTYQGVYANYLDADDTGNRVRAAFGANYDRFVQLKTRYDPTNFFRFNQNIQPATKPPA